LRVKKKIKVQLLLSHYQQGFSLIEVMVAALILSFGLLGFAQGQLMAFRTSQHAYLLSLADLKNNELAERLRICGIQSRCIQQELSLWKIEVNKSFPEGKAQVLVKDLNYQSKIQWFSLDYQATLFLYLLFRL
jgi:prepilin-type N-terminal cleavage/methylation domain-containing protein